MIFPVHVKELKEEEKITIRGSFPTVMELILQQGGGRNSVAGNRNFSGEQFHAEMRISMVCFLLNYILQVSTSPSPTSFVHILLPTCLLLNFPLSVRPFCLSDPVVLTSSHCLQLSLMICLKGTVGRKILIFFESVRFRPG